jgi:pentatricopeptide repeat protein
VIRKLGSSKLPRSAFSVYEWLHTRDEKPDIFIYSSILGVIQRSGQFEFVSRVMEHMKMNGVEPDLVAYKIIISSYEHMDLHEEAMAMLEELLGKGLVLDDMATFQILLEGSEKAMDIHSALRLYTLAKSVMNSDDADANDIASQFKATVSGIAYRTIRNMLGGSLQISSCADILELIDKVEEAITDLCLGDYQGIIWCCGRAPEDHMVAYQMLTRTKPYPVSVSVCNHAMNILGKANKWEASLDVFERMLAHGPTPDKDSYLLVRSQFNSLLSSSREVRNSCWTLEILERMESQGIVPDQYAWDTSLITCAKRADLDGALLVFERMVEKGHVPSLISYGALLTSLEKCGFFGEAEQVWHHMKKLGIKPISRRTLS